MQDNIIDEGVAQGDVPEDYGILSTDDAFTAFIKRYRNDPVGFAENVIGFMPQDWQATLFRNIAKGQRLTSIRAGHGVGKTSGVAVITVWMLVVGHHGDLKIVVTAPTHSTLQDGLFAEIKKWFKKTPPIIQDLFEIQSERIYMRAAPESVFCTARVSGINNPEALAGIHADKVLIIVDEATGVPDQVFHVARGSMSSDGAQTILISNPTKQSGFFFDTHHSLASKWSLMHVSCKDNPRVSADFESEFVYGDDDPEKQVRFYGNFASYDDNVLINAELVDSAMVRDIQVDPNADLIYGLDCARFGADKSCLVKRKGNVVISMETWAGLDTMQLAGIVKSNADSDHPTVICVDSIGVGAGVADRLRELGMNVRDINVAESSAMNPQAAKLRDELWIEVKRWLEQRACKLPNDPQLRKELVAPRLEYLGNGKMKVEGKDSIRKRLKGASPDHADALCLTFAATAAGIGGNSPKWVKGQPLKRNLRAVI